MEKKEVRLDKELFDELASKLPGTSFASVDDYVSYLVRVQLGKKQAVFDDKDNSAVEERLKALGYI